MPTNYYKKLLLFVIPAILLMALFGFQLLGSSQPIMAEGNTKSNVPEVDKAYLDLLREFKYLKIENESTKPKRSKIKWRDPFVRPYVAQNNENSPRPATNLVKTKNLDLAGVLWDEQSPSAVINGEIVQVGSLIDSYRVIRIRPNSVTLTSQGRRIILKLSEEKGTR